MTYGGDDRVRPDEVRLRAAPNKARLRRRTAELRGDRLTVAGTISDRARGIVRIRLGYIDGDGTVAFLHLRAPIENGAWKVTERLRGPAAAGGQLSIQYTGYAPRRIRGEQDAKRVTP